MSSEPSFALLAAHTRLFPHVSQWLRTEWPTWYGSSGPGDADADVQRYAQTEQVPLGLLGFIDGQVCAFGALKHDKVPGFEERGPWLGAGYVLPNLRGKGLGLELLKALEVQAKRLGHDSLFCATATAQSLLERADYLNIGSSTLGEQTVAIYQKKL